MDLAVLLTKSNNRFVEVNEECHLDKVIGSQMPRILGLESGRK